MHGLSKWWVYIIEASDNRLYCGITTDLVRRWSEHANLAGGVSKGAKFFRGRDPKAFRFVDAASDRSDASKYEAKIKKMSRKDKLILIESTANRIHQFESVFEEL